MWDDNVRYCYRLQLANPENITIGPPERIFFDELVRGLEKITECTENQELDHKTQVVTFQPPASSLQPPASSLQPPASSLQPPASSLQPPASSLQLSGTAPPSSLISTQDCLQKMLDITESAKNAQNIKDMVNPEKIAIIGMRRDPPLNETAFDYQMRHHFSTFLTLSSFLPSFLLPLLFLLPFPPLLFPPVYFLSSLLSFHPFFSSSFALS
jgi:hypothetical protein